jgi:hypothetical protein
MAPLVGEPNTGCRIMLSDERKEYLLALWDMLGLGAPPKTHEDWDLVEFGMWAAQTHETRINNAYADRERVSLLLARKMKNEKISARKAVDQLYGHIYYLNNPKNLIGADTLVSWATRRGQNHETPNERLKKERSSFGMSPNQLNEDIEFWEKMNVTPINEGLPKGW